jgi:SAM-dependent methyltransferase
MVFTPLHSKGAAEEEVDLDYLEEVRIGHPQIVEEEAYIIDLVKGYAQQSSQQLRVFIIHGRIGAFAAKLIAAVPEIELIVYERFAPAIARLQKRFANSVVKVFTERFSEWNEPIDIFISKGIHHHAAKSYLENVKRLIKPEGLLILGDEFCPEYCTGKYAEHIQNAEQLYLAGGYVLTNSQQVTAFEERGEIPQIAKEIERLRQQALWTWYKYVVDYAMERDCLKVAIEELRATYEDLITNNNHEHKMSPLILEKEMELCGFKLISKKLLAPPEPVENHSFFTYEFKTK